MLKRESVALPLFCRFSALCFFVFYAIIHELKYLYSEDLFWNANKC